ncbi:hypothetical protein ACSTKX_24450, partial [Vibrio parahaemolyticus]
HHGGERHGPRHRAQNRERNVHRIAREQAGRPARADQLRQRNHPFHLAHV